MTCEQRCNDKARQQSMHIRVATGLDRDDVRRVHLSAFPEGEREIVADLAVSLLAENTTPPVISLVAEADGAVVGHVAFSPVVIDGNWDLRGYILAPLAVEPAYQKRRIGSQLVESGIRRLSEIGVGILFVYGDPTYYGRFGFSVDAAERYIPPYSLQYAFGWQGVVLTERRVEGPPVKITCVAPLCDPALW